jgi:hypothetical protein
MLRPEAVLKGRVCQCSVCGLVFSTEGNFDRHRKGDHRASRYCVTPSEAGLTARETKHGTVYAQPGTFYTTEEKQERLSAAFNHCDI